jgi:hypothetical protein
VRHRRRRPPPRSEDSCRTPPSPTTRNGLRPPQPEPSELSADQVARALALCAIEIIAGARELETIARWIDDDVHRHLQRRIVIAARGRSVRRQEARRPMLRAGGVRTTEVSPGIVEASVVVHVKPRTKAVALRLERAHDGRWRATAISVL